ncbi:MAG: 50S ribosomal protein L11 methyltransferase [Flavobacteriales bacterium]|nr:50S ribosomal protein L11 methyltransferase [Flavobacteriales bacterium]MCB9193908.1 50S ribosomal protein L11 methyltransferase [Flavobacteriales bacterium]
MPYTELELAIDPVDPWRDILIAELSELGYESFEEITGGLKAYIPSDRFDRQALRRTIAFRDPHVHVAHTVHEIQDTNWNAVWEAGFQPVRIGRQVLIRAEHHPQEVGFTHEIVITPRMAFGTGHHATTRSMVRAMLDLDLHGRTVCDLGCGTGVLAILAERMGAAHVRAIDIDPQAVANALDNVRHAHCERTVVEKGDARLLGPASCDTILANIERNTLLRDMVRMGRALRPGGDLLLSGFLTKDLDRMRDGAIQAGLVPVSERREGDWAMLGVRTEPAGTNA